MERGQNHGDYDGKLRKEPHLLDHRRIAQGWADEDSGAARHYMDASLRGLREEEKQKKARTDDVVVVKAGHSVRSVYEDDAQEGREGARAESAGAGADSASAATTSAGARAGPAGAGAAGGKGAGGVAAGAGGSDAGASVATHEVCCGHTQRLGRKASLT